MPSIFEVMMKISDAEEALDAADMRSKAAKCETLEAEKQWAQAYQLLEALRIELQVAEAEAAAATAAAVAAAIKRPDGTKYKWTHKYLPNTYIVAIQTKDGILQVKSVVNGVPEIRLARKLFTDLLAWDETLPMNQGKLTVTSAPITDKEMKMLFIKPLNATEDALQLKELEERFPGGVFVLSIPNKQPAVQYEISYKLVGNTYHQIYNEKLRMSFFNFADYGVLADEKPQLAVEWKGYYVDLSHLF